jgi:hypothetical protein
MTLNRALWLGVLLGCFGCEQPTGASVFRRQRGRVMTADVYRGDNFFRRQFMEPTAVLSTTIPLTAGYVAEFA